MIAGKRTETPGRVRFGGPEAGAVRASSVVISKIRNYAGFMSFGVSAEDDCFEGLYIRHDTPGGLAALYASIGARGLSGGRIGALGPVRAVPDFAEARWISDSPAHVQLDGEAVEFDDTRRLHVRIDPVPQRYLLPARR
jgi:hypothetical protein